MQQHTWKAEQNEREERQSRGGIQGICREEGREKVDISQDVYNIVSHLGMNTGHERDT